MQKASDFKILLKFWAVLHSGTRIAESKGERGVRLATGMWTAVSGAMARSKVVDTISNNLANQDSVGFKKDTPNFKEYLAIEENAPEMKDIARGPITEKDLHPIEGADQSFVIVDGTHTDFSQGSLEVTHRSLDFAIDGPGFVEVFTPQGIRLTRAGSLKVQPDGTVVTSGGHPVLTSGGAQSAPLTIQDLERYRATGERPESIRARLIQLPRNEVNLTIQEDGAIFSGGRSLGRMSLVEPSNPGALMKDGQMLFRETDLSGRRQAVEESRIIQGVLERSNVNPIEEMTKLISAHRNYETSLKAISTYDNVMQKQSNELGKF